MGRACFAEKGEQENAQALDHFSGQFEHESEGGFRWSPSRG